MDVIGAALALPHVILYLRFDSYSFLALTHTHSLRAQHTLPSLWLILIPLTHTHSLRAQHARHADKFCINLDLSWVRRHSVLVPRLKKGKKRKGRAVGKRTHYQFSIKTLLSKKKHAQSEGSDRRWNTSLGSIRIHELKWLDMGLRRQNVWHAVEMPTVLTWGWNGEKAWLGVEIVEMAKGLTCHRTRASDSKGFRCQTASLAWLARLAWLAISSLLHPLRRPYMPSSCHTLTHTNRHTHTHTLSLSLSLTRTHTHTHTQHRPR